MLASDRQSSLQPAKSGVTLALHLKEGDELVYHIEGERVILSKAQRKKEADNPFHTFREWDSVADKKAYANL